VFLARDLAVEDVVEEKLGHHGRDHLVDLTPGEVDQHALQPADLTRHIQPHAGEILQRGKNRVRSAYKLMRVSMAVLVLSLAAAPSILAAPRITFERQLPAPHDLGGAEELALVNAIGDSVKVEAFIGRFIEQVNRSGRLRMRDARRDSDKTGADAYLSVKTFTCETRTGGAEGSAYDVDGKRVKRRFVWSDALCMARIDVAAGRQRSSFYVKGEGTSPRVFDLTDEEKNVALEQAAKYAAVDAAERITPRRVRESIPLDETAPSFEEGYARIDVERFQDAREIWEDALRKQPRSAPLHYNLGAVCEALGDHKAAELHYVAARQLAPAEPRYASELRSFHRRNTKP
jgi:tetratricopeptide (TPR) repeat protein